MELSQYSAHKGAPIQSAYEDVRLAPSNPLLDSLNNFGFCFPRSYSIQTPDMEDFYREETFGPATAVPSAPSGSSDPFYLDPSKLYRESEINPTLIASPWSFVDPPTALPDLSLTSLNDLVGSYLISNHAMPVRLDLDPDDVYKSRVFLASVTARPLLLRDK